MFKLVKEYRFYFTLAILFLIPILSLNTSEKDPSDFNGIDRFIVATIAPFQGLISYGLEETSAFFENYLFLVHLRKDHAAVLEENRKLFNQIHSYKEMEAENHRLRALLEFQSHVSEKKTSAQVISTDVSNEFRLIRINKGSSSGILRGMPVVTHEGVVGKILRTATNYADVITILDNLATVDAIIQRSRARGTLEGATDDLCILRYALRTDDIQEGDIVETSGLGGVYPKGLKLGVVSKVKQKTYGVTQEVEILPSVDFSKLEEVIIIMRNDPLRIESAEF